MTVETATITDRLNAIERELDELDGTRWPRYLPVVESLRFVVAELQRSVRQAREERLPDAYPLPVAFWIHSIDDAEGACQLTAHQLVGIREQLFRDMKTGRSTLYTALQCCRSTIDHLVQAGCRGVML